MATVWTVRCQSCQTPCARPARLADVITAFVSISAAPADIAKLGAAIADLAGVREVHSTTGDHDLLAILWVRSHEEIATTVTEHICRLPGVRETRTSIAFRTYGTVDDLTSLPTLRLRSRDRAQPLDHTDQTGGFGMRAIRPLRDFLSTEAAGGLLLVLATVVALVWANSPWRASYESFWSTDASIRIGTARGVSLDLRHWVNEGLMTLFFFIVGLEIKRELVEGELRDPKRAALPAIAALGGMVVPAAIYFAVNAGSNGARGWGIPMATDIAMALGALAILGRHLHPAHKLFLLALAIVDDVGAVMVIAVFYSSGIDGSMLIVAGTALFAILGMRRAGVQRITAYVAVGVVLWYATKGAGIHATLTGVVVGLLTPTKPAVPMDLVDQDALNDISSLRAAEETMQIARQSVSVVEWLEHRLHPWTSYVIVPLFALANAGIRLDGSSMRAALTSRVGLGIVLGLVAGKVIGISLASWLAVRAGVASLPDGLTFRSLVGVAAIAGMGFTVSLFVTDLAFRSPEQTGPAKLAVLIATVCAAVLGGLLLRGAERGQRSDPGGA